MTTDASTADDLLEVATGAERWIDSHRHDTADGVVWGLANEAPEKYVHNLYSGSAGIALYYLELHKATGEQSYLDIAHKAGTELLSKIRTLESLPCAFMGGWGGYLFVLHQLFAATGHEEFRQIAHQCAQKQHDQSQPIGAGIGWIQEMPYAKLTGHKGVREIYDVAEGAAGAALAWLYAHENELHEHALDWSRQAADRLIEVAQTATGGRRWQLMNDIPWPFDAPNFAHGTAGVAFFMARLYELTNEQTYLDAAIAGAGHVQAMAEDIDGGGYLVPHVLDDGRPNRYYLGACHGPAGTARLFYLLSEVTGEQSWMEWSRGLDDGMLALGAPEERSRGFWNNISQCCCDAGIGDHALHMFHATDDEFYMNLARRIGVELVRRGQRDGTKWCWPQAEHRTQPDFVQSQTGYMQGAAGVGSFLLHLATTLDGAPVKIVFPDSPYDRILRA